MYEDYVLSLMKSAALLLLVAATLTARRRLFVTHAFTLAFIITSGLSQFLLHLSRRFSKARAKPTNQKLCS